MYLFDEQPILANKALARELGLNEALVLQQINYWIEINKKSGNNYHDGKYWTYNSIRAWQEKDFDYLLKDIKGLFKVQDKAKFLKQNIPYLAFFYVSNIFSHHVRAYNGGYVIDKIFQGILELNTMSFIPSIHPTDILMGVGVAALIKFVVYTKGKNAKKFRHGKEYGSARWSA